MSGLIKLILKSTLSRWVTVGVVTLLLGGAVAGWYNYKAGLREEGKQECVQLVNEDTMLQLEDALAAEKVARANLQSRLALANQVNAEARDRQRELETSLTVLAEEMERQRNEDPEYRDWSDTALPDGVADRLRWAKARVDSSTIREDSS